MKFGTLPAVVFLVFCLGNSAHAQYQGYLAQAVNGIFGSYRFATTFVLFNHSDTAVTATLKLTDEAGNPWAVTISGLGRNSQFIISLDPGATQFLQTDGLGTGVMGGGTVTATAAIGISAIFTVYDTNGNFMTEAGVGSSDLLTDFELPVDFTGSFLTGLALYSPAGASLTLTLINADGSQAGTELLSLSSGAHVARFVGGGAGQFFATIGNFRGTLRVQSSAPIAALVLRQFLTASQLTYTSLPVVAHSSTKLTFDLAQVANGSFGGFTFQTSFLIFSLSSTPAHVTLALEQDNGTPLTVSIPGSGPGTGTGSSFSFTLPAGASAFLQTDGKGDGKMGAATIVSDVPIGASSIFTVQNSQGQFETEAGVGDSAVLTSLTLPVDITGAFDTGVAFFNPGNTSVTLTLKLLDATGTIIGVKTQSLAPNNHLAVFVDQLFPGTASFRGSLAITASGPVASTTLRQYSPSPSLITYTTLPNSAGTATGKTASPVLVSKTDSGIAATGNVVRNVTLPSGFKLTGTVTGTAFTIYVQAGNGDNTYRSSSILQANGQYLIVAPAGTYNLRVAYDAPGLPAGAYLQMTYADPLPVQLSGDTVRNITVPAATLYGVSGSVLGLANLPAGPATTIYFTSNDYLTQGFFPLDAGGNFQGKLPEGSFQVSLYRAGIALRSGQVEQLAIYNLGSLVVGSGPVSGTYMVPTMGTLSGTISTGPLTGGLYFTLTAVDPSALQAPPSSFIGAPATSYVFSTFERFRPVPGCLGTKPYLRY